MADAALSSCPAATAEENHCTAFNAAFHELGLNWRWAPGACRDLERVSGERERIRFYLETRQTQLLSTYDKEFLVDAIHAAKTRWLSAIVAGGDTGSHGIPREGRRAEAAV